ncbi:FG-GAP repeat protein [Leucobacter weissii]|uniref:FG-GAP repeat protein n=1 Tax=Leucobacter weissii TaxID=1983706 RepID=A0A939MJQ9_9MICO|nr:integrin alpha [Leucobacter weissii]MBO1902238.1 FG-GAP repeat protein [Leucobacter weissii]
MVTHEKTRGITRAGLGVIASGALILGAAVPALAITPPTTITDVPTYTTQVGGDLGYSASRVSGDVNGDGKDDTVVGDWWYDKGGYTNAGGAYILFGGTSFTGGQLTPDNALPDGAVLIQGPDEGNAFAGISVSIAGDVNGDGYDDVIIGSNRTQRVWVVFGSGTLPSVIDVEEFATTGLGFEITNSVAVNNNDNLGKSSNFGYWVSTAGDVNGDTYDEVIIVDNLWDGPNGDNAGRAWVITGGTGLSGVIDVATTGASQVHATIDGASANSQILVAENIGDVNGDDTPDVGIGSYTSTVGGATATGVAYAVFGDAAGGTVDLSDFESPVTTTDGFAVYGPDRGRDRLGTSIAALGDLNDDGYDDFAVGGDGVTSGTAIRTGGVAVVYGSDENDVVYTDPSDPNASPAYTSPSSVYELNGVTKVDRGYWINGVGSNDKFGWAAASIPDINDDDERELVVGAWSYDKTGGTNSGAVYVVNSGVTAGITLETSGFTTSLAGAAGFRIDGLAGNSQLGRSVGGITDFDGGGYPSIVGGANGAGTSGVGADYASVFRLS